MRASIVLTALVLAVPLARAQAPAGETLSVDSKASTITYHIVHKLHRVDGTSKKVEGKARLAAGGQVQVMVRVPAESFDSDNVNRDAHMKEAVEAARFPMIELKALGDGVTVPTTFPSTIEKKLHAQLTFHGITKPLEIPVKIAFESASKAKATTTFSVSLDEFKVERPALMFVKIDDEMKVDASLALTK